MQPNDQNALLTNKKFNEQYWFTPLQMVTVINPRDTDYPFMVEMRHYIIKAGAQQSFPGVIANVYLGQMSKIMAQDNDNLGSMADPELKKHYYDQLIVNVEDMAQEADNRPAYIKNVPQEAVADAPDATPPWQKSGTTASEPEKPAIPTVPQTKEFELEGDKYRLVVSEDGRKMHYKNGKLTGAAEYAKAASML